MGFLDKWFGYDKLEEARRELEESMRDMGIWYVALVDFMCELKALNNEEVNKLFEKYQVIIKKGGE